MPAGLDAGAKWGGNVGVKKKKKERVQQRLVALFRTRFPPDRKERVYVTGGLIWRGHTRGQHSVRTENAP